MRRLSSFVAAAAVGGLLVGLAPAMASAAPTVPQPLFGQHVASIANGAPGGLEAGAIRLWDSGVTWREVEYADNKYDWSKLDAAVANARRLGASEVLYTLGSTPRWAASDPNSKLGLYGPGSNSHPKSNELYLDYLRAVLDRYGDRITAYQIWNEANLRDFYLGTPAQMATLTKQAYSVIKSQNPNAKVVAASTTVRAKGPVGRFGKAYGAAMRKVGWPVDVVSAHFYPPAKEGPATRVAYMKKIKSYYKRYGAGRKPLWDTEMSYGDTRAYMKTKRTYTGATAATYVARTFIDSMRYGVSRVFWYGWDIHALGTDMTARDGSGSMTAGGRAFLETRDWMAGKTWLGCRAKSSITTCTVVSPNGSRQAIRYAAGTKPFTVPAGTTRMRFLDGSSQDVTPGTRVTLTTQPVLFS